VKRVGAVDLGTNSTRLLVADVTDGQVHEIVRVLEITRLGQRVDRDGLLAADAIGRVLAVLDTYRRLAVDAGATTVLATATSAVRDAANGADLLARIERTLGFRTRLLSGDEEARATVAGVLAGRVAPPGRVAIVDVGGGSTEVAIAHAGTLEAAVSVNAGCVRATERWLGDGVVAAADLAIARTALDGLFAGAVPDAWLPVDDVIAVAGTATTAAAIDLELVEHDPARSHGHVVPVALVRSLIERLAPLDSDARGAIRGIEPARAPVIVGGLVVLDRVLTRLGADRFEVSERDILHGIALLAAVS
jgi:exopolyphosphatase/guanosine-5'-triphosphate,3'-diphosphate pyrophosphatase